MLPDETLPPLSLYIHIPWCVRKCPYCDFNSHVGHQSLPEMAYLEALKNDLALDLKYVQGRSLQSIFIGGGTPSLMSGSFYEHLLAFVEAEIPFSPEIEITLEANPGTTEAGRFEHYHHSGINRLSLGVQSFSDTQLRALGRIHSAEQAHKAIDMAKHAGFGNFNIDLMHGLPGQTLEDALADLRQAMDHAPAHVSWYQLTIEPNTEFYSKPPTLPVDDTLWDIQTQGNQLLASQGYTQYEVSAYAKANQKAVHNLNYWTFGDYIGIGAGAHSKITLGDSKRILRYRKSRQPKDYLMPRPTYQVGVEHLESDSLPFEFLMNVLRLKEGVDARMFERRTGLPIATIARQVKRLREEGLMEGHRLGLTQKGFLFLDSVLERFID